MTLQEEFVMYYEDYELEDIHEFNKKILQYMLLYNTERPHHSLNKKSPLQYFCDIINSNKSEFSQTGMTYTREGAKIVLDSIRELDKKSKKIK